MPDGRIEAYVFCEEHYLLFTGQKQQLIVTPSSRKLFNSSKNNPTQRKMPKLLPHTRRALTKIDEHGNRCHIVIGRIGHWRSITSGRSEYNPPNGSNWAPAWPMQQKKGPRVTGKRSKTAASSIIPNSGKNLVSPNTLRERESEREGDGARMMSGEMLKNMECEPKFRKYVYGIVREFNAVVHKELKIAGAERAGVSAQTANRYLEKMCSFAGSLEVFRNQDGELCVRLRAQATPQPSAPALPERKSPPTPR